jgi:hypothetical protein
VEIINNKAVLFRTRHDPSRFQIIPKHKVVEQYDDGGAAVAVHWGLDEMRVLRNLGVRKAPSPIIGRYDWPGRFKPAQHQIETAAFLTLYRRCFCFNEPGTMKTSSALWAADFLMNIGHVRRVLVLCPMSIMYSAWMGDISKTIIHRSAIVAHHTKASRRVEMVKKGYEIVVTNYEGLNLIAHEIREDGRFDLVIVDECFIEGTPVLTPRGATPIEKLSAGDDVLTSAGVKRIKTLVRKTTKRLVRVRTSDGQEITCTPEHPFFTDVGWVTAEHLVGRRLVSAHELPRVQHRIPGPEGGIHVAPLEGYEHRADLLKILRSEEVPHAEPGRELLQPHEARGARDAGRHSADAGATGARVESTESVGTQTDAAWWEWDWHDAVREAGVRGASGGVGMELPRSVGGEAARLSHELQARLRAPAVPGGVGGGRQQPHKLDTTHAGHQEGTRARATWVVGISYIECESDFPVFNLEVEGVPNYFVGNGVLVHNCNAYKNTTTQRWKALHAVLKPETLLWMMTGTPASQSPVDAFGLARLVCPQNVPKYVTAWKEKVQTKVTNFKWVSKPNAKDMVFEALQPAIRFAKKDCLDLPPVVTETREVPMTPQQKKYYELLKNQMLFQAAGETISAVNAGVAVSKLLQISCIAYNTPVLTDSGWVPIQEVRATDLVWDGEEFVAHQGLLHRGRKYVLECFGVTMTHDHRVLTEGGWRTAWSCLYECGKGFGRAEVRLPDGTVAAGYERWQNEEGPMALSVRLRNAGGARKPVSADTASPRSEALRVPARQQDARHVKHTALPDMVEHAQALPGPQRQGLAQLRGTRCQSEQQVGREFRGVLGGRRPDVLVFDDLGTQEQQRSVLEGQLPLGNATRAGEQHTQNGVVANAKRVADAGTGGACVRASLGHTKRALEALWVGVGKGLGDSRTAEVFDIAHCGPRNRFVVLGEDGEPLTVHNCGAAYTDDREVVEFDAGPRLGVLREVLEETDRKVIIFASYRSSMDTIEAYLTKHGYNVAQINGDVSASKRGRIIDEFQDKDTLHALVLQSQATAHGITLTAADTAVFWGPVMSVELYLQCIARIDRKGQDSESVRVIHIQSSPIEEKMFKAMGRKVSDHSLLVDLFDSEIKS